MDVAKIVEAVLGPLKELLAAGGVDFPPHKPERLMIGCVDARMPVAAFGYAPGTTLIKRSIAALIPPPDKDYNSEMAGTLEFAIKGKQVKEIVVMGHTNCGGIGACLDHPHDMPAVTEYLKPLEHVALDIKNQRGDKVSQARAMEIAAVCMSLENLALYPCVQEAKGLRLKGQLFDVRNNKKYDIDNSGTDFRLVPAEDLQAGVWQKRRSPSSPRGNRV